ncbi:hypothetical protein COCOBI_11-5790 [Coccomyxa sp. Obi]|nr:hypothetical protein COCOBI_11-5790 [Coccomyxa sp. Obi]
MAVDTAEGDADFPELDDIMDPDIQRILDEADLMEASDDDDEGTERGIESEAEHSRSGNSNSEASDTESDHDSEATVDDARAGEGAVQEIEGASADVDAAIGNREAHQSATAAAAVEAGQSPSPVQAPGASLLPKSPEDEPIGCRTRTRLPMQHLSLDDLDGLLTEEGSDLFDEEGEQYQQFLRVLRGEEDPLELYDGEDDDEDFVLDWEELMGTNFDDPTAAGSLNSKSKQQWLRVRQRAGASEPPPPPRRSNRIRKYVYAPKHLRPGHQERPVQSTLLLQTRQLKQLLPAMKPPEPPPQPAPPAQPPLPPGRAAAAMAMRWNPPPTLADPPSVATKAPLPGWKPEQVARLHRQVAQHVQLLLTSFAAAGKLPGGARLVASVGQLIHTLQNFPARIRAWPLIMSLVRAMSEAASLDDALVAMERLPAQFSASLLPVASNLSLERQWLPAEDAQLARGMLRFGQDMGKLRRYFLPVRTEEDIRARIAQYCSRKIGANPIKAALDRVKGPLTPQEMAHIETALRYYGRQLNRWELIVAQFMPYRTATQLSRLWGIHMKAKEAVAALTTGTAPGSDARSSGQSANAPPAIAGGPLHLAHTPAASAPAQPTGDLPARQKRRYTKRQPPQQPAAPAGPSQSGQLPVPSSIPSQTAQQSPATPLPSSVAQRSAGSAAPAMHSQAAEQHNRPAAGQQPPRPLLLQRPLSAPAQPSRLQQPPGAAPRPQPPLPTIPPEAVRQLPSSQQPSPATAGPQLPLQRPSLQRQPFPGPIYPHPRPAQQHASQQRPPLAFIQHCPTPPIPLEVAQRPRPPPQASCAAHVPAAARPSLAAQMAASALHSAHGPQPTAVNSSQQPPQLSPYKLQQPRLGVLHLAPPPLPRVPASGLQLVQHGPGTGQQSSSQQQHSLAQAIDTRNKYRDPSTALAIEQQKQQAQLQQQAAQLHAAQQQAAQQQAAQQQAAQQRVAKRQAAQQRASQQQSLAAKVSGAPQLPDQQEGPPEPDTSNKYRRKNPREWPPIQPKAVTPLRLEVPPAVAARIEQWSWPKEPIAPVIGVPWPRPDIDCGRPRSATAAQAAAPRSAPPSGHSSPDFGGASAPRSTTTSPQQQESAGGSQAADAAHALTPKPSLTAGERPRSAAFPVNGTTRARPRKATPKRGLSLSPVRRIAKPSEISLSPLSPERGTPAKRQKLSHGRGKKKLSASPVTRSARLQARKAGAGAEEVTRPNTRARAAKDSGPPGTAGAPTGKRQLRGRKGTAPKRNAARIESDDDLDVDSWGPLSLLTLAETASRQAQEMQEADEAAAAAAAQQERDGGTAAAAEREAMDPLKEFVTERRRVLEKARTPEPLPPTTTAKTAKRPEPKIDRANVDAVHRQLQLQAAAAEERIAMELHRRGKRPFAAATAPAAAAPAAAAAAGGLPARPGSLGRAGTSETVLGIPYTPQHRSNSAAPRSTPTPSHPVQQRPILTAGAGPAAVTASIVRKSDCSSRHRSCRGAPME